MHAEASVLAWDGCVNVRDLGGHPTEYGAATRFGAVVRADSLRKLTEAGWRALVDYRVRTIVDLRFHEELAADPPLELPVEVVHVPVLPEPGDPQWDEIDAVSRAAPDEIASTRLAYIEFLERRRSRFGEAVAAVAEAAPGPVVVHCLVGKDRTGLVSALLLRLAGVSRERIGADYAQSGEGLRAVHKAWIAEAPDEREATRRRRISATPSVAMVGVLEEIERRYGDVRGYLLAAGVTESTLARARARLRG